jgi:hypothetical protein
MAADYLHINDISREKHSLAGDLFSLLKPRLSLLVIFTSALGLFLAPVEMEIMRAIIAILATSGLVGGACAINCYMERDIDGGKEKLSCNFPFVASAQKELTEPRIPNMRGIMAARTKPLQVLEAQTSTIGSLTQSFELPAPKGACKMIDASKLLVGIVDLSCFYPAKEIKSDKNNAKIVNLIRRINEIRIEETKIKGGRLIIIKIKAPSFFRHLVRNIVGTIVWVGLKKISITDFQAIIANKKRDLAGPTAPPHGLYFDEVEY